MRRPFVILIASARHIALTGCLLGFCLALTGCADINPFASSSNPEESVYSQFSDIPVPKGMSTKASRTFVNYGEDGSKIGLETLEGSINCTSLTRVMINNMLRDGWALRATTSGAGRFVQVFEKEKNYAVIYYYEQTASYAMEIWVASRLAEGAYQAPPMTPYTPANSGSSGGSANSSGAANSASSGGMGGNGGYGAASAPESGRSIPVYHGGDGGSAGNTGSGSATSGNAGNAGNAGNSGNAGGLQERNLP